MDLGRQPEREWDRQAEQQHDVHQEERGLSAEKERKHQVSSDTDRQERVGAGAVVRPVVPEKDQRQESHDDGRGEPPDLGVGPAQHGLDYTDVPGTPWPLRVSRACDLKESRPAGNRTVWAAMGRKGGQMPKPLLLALFSTALFAAPDNAPENPWAPVQFLVGEWDGDSEGQPGKGTVKRTYRFALLGKFLHEQNVSTYPPQPRNEKGEVHEHWSFFSFDRARRLLVLRQFHQEGFVNQYAQAAASRPGRIVFETEALENVPATWKARETYDVVSPDEFVETFELANGSGPYEVYSRTRFKRAKLR
jgi:hypothetical protein